MLESPNCFILLKKIVMEMLIINWLLYTEFVPWLWANQEHPTLWSMFEDLDDIFFISFIS